MCFVDTFKLYSTYVVKLESVIKTHFYAMSVLKVYVFACEVNVIFLILGNSPKKVFLYETSINSVESAMCVLFKSKTVLFLNFLLSMILEKTRNRSRGVTSELLFAFSIIILN